MSTIIFDFDGTIADTFPVVLDIFHKVSRRKVLLTPEEAHLLRGVALRQVKGRTALKHANSLHVAWWRIPFLFLVCRAILKTRMQDVKMYPGVHDVIKELHQQGHHLIILSTNTTYNIETFLRNERVRSYFSAIYGGVGSGKKSKVLRALIKRRKVEATSWLIGDEGRDIIAANKAGVKSIAVTWGYNDRQQLEAQTPTKIAQVPQDIRKIIGEK